MIRTLYSSCAVCSYRHRSSRSKIIRVCVFLGVLWHNVSKKWANLAANLCRSTLNFKHKHTLTTIVLSQRIQCV
uniref:Uncharacterized protein n=1 Tax=Anopheles minimus TaxID=112268 RepID=A0A182WCH8_9DIPT